MGQGREEEVTEPPFGLVALKLHCTAVRLPWWRPLLRRRMRRDAAAIQRHARDIGERIDWRTGEVSYGRQPPW